jgi:hypothetical protein
MPLGSLERWLNRIVVQVLAHCVPGQSRPPGDLPDRKLITKMPAPDNAQQCHVYHSVVPRRNHAGVGLNMGQFSVKKSGNTGSVLGENQQAGRSFQPELPAPVLKLAGNRTRRQLSLTGRVSLPAKASGSENSLGAKTSQALEPEGKLERTTVA